MSGQAKHYAMRDRRYVLTELIRQLAHHEGEGAPPDLRDVPRRRRRKQERRHAVVAMAAAAAAGLAPRRRAGAPLLLQRQPGWRLGLASRDLAHQDCLRRRHGGGYGTGPSSERRLGGAQMCPTTEG